MKYHLKVMVEKEIDLTQFISIPRANWPEQIRIAVLQLPHGKLKDIVLTECTADEKRRLILQLLSDTDALIRRAQDE